MDHDFREIETVQRLLGEQVNRLERRIEALAEMQAKQIKLENQLQRYTAEIDEHKDIDATFHAEIRHRLEGIENFLYKGNGNDPATTRLSRADEFMQVVERFIMKHEAEHEGIKREFKEWTLLRGKVLGGLLMANAAGGVIGALIGYIVARTFGAQ